MSINKNGDNTMYARILAALVATVMSGLIFTAHAQEFPNKPLKMVIPFPPGGAGDITTRILADTMSKGLGQPVIVDNRPGAGAVTGYEFVARAPADGYTILVVFPSFVINPAIRTGLSYDPIKDFQPIGQSMWLPMAIVVGMNVPAPHSKTDRVGELQARRNCVRNARRRHDASCCDRNVQACRRDQYFSRSLRWWRSCVDSARGWASADGSHQRH